MEYMLKQIEPGNDNPIIIPLHQNEVIIGRRKNADLRNYQQVSRQHAAIHRIQGIYYIRDLSTYNNLYVNRTSVGKDMRRLEVGDLIAFGTPSPQNGSGGFLCMFCMRMRVKKEPESDDDDVMIIENVKEEIMETVPPVPSSEPVIAEVYSVGENSNQSLEIISASLEPSRVNENSSQSLGDCKTSGKPLVKEKESFTIESSTPVEHFESVEQKRILSFQNRSEVATDTLNGMEVCEMSERNSRIVDELRERNGEKVKLRNQKENSQDCVILEERKGGDKVAVEEKANDKVKVKENNQEIGPINITGSVENSLSASSISVQYSNSVTGSNIQVFSGKTDPPKLFTIAKDIKTELRDEEKIPTLLNSLENGFLSPRSNFLKTTLGIQKETLTSNSPVPCSSKPHQINFVEQNYFKLRDQISVPNGSEGKIEREKINKNSRIEDDLHSKETFTLAGLNYSRSLASNISLSNLERLSTFAESFAIGHCGNNLISNVNQSRLMNPISNVIKKSINERISNSSKREFIKEPSFCSLDNQSQLSRIQNKSGLTAQSFLTECFENNLFGNSSQSRLIKPFNDIIMKVVDNVASNLSKKEFVKENKNELFRMKNESRNLECSLTEQANFSADSCLPNVPENRFSSRPSCDMKEKCYSDYSRTAYSLERKHSFSEEPNSGSASQSLENKQCYLPEYIYNDCSSEKHNFDIPCPRNRCFSSESKSENRFSDAVSDTSCPPNDRHTSFESNNRLNSLRMSRIPVFSTLPDSLLETKNSTSCLDKPRPVSYFSKLTECSFESNNMHRFLETAHLNFPRDSGSRQLPLELNNGHTDAEKPFSIIPDLPDNYRFPFEETYENISSGNLTRLVVESICDVDILEDCRVLLERCDSEHFCLPPDVRWTNKVIDIKLLKKRRETSQKQNTNGAPRFRSHTLKPIRNKLSSSDVDQKSLKKKKFESIKIISDSETFYSTDPLSSESGEKYSSDENEENCSELLYPSHIKSQQKIKKTAELHENTYEPSPSTFEDDKVSKSSINFSSHQLRETNGVVKISEMASDKPNIGFHITEESDSNKNQYFPCIKQHLNVKSMNKDQIPRQKTSNLQIQTTALKRLKTCIETEENVEGKKKIRKALLTEPKPMEKRPKYARGREEWFEERISESPLVSSTPVEETPKPPKKHVNPPSSLIKSKNSNCASRMIAERSLIGFRIPKRSKDDSKEAQSSVKQKKTTKVPRRSEKCSSRMGFLTDVLKVKPVSRSNVVNKHPVEEVEKSNSREKKQTHEHRAKRGLEILSTICSGGKAAEKCGPSETLRHSTVKKVRFSDTEKTYFERSTPRVRPSISLKRRNVAVIEPFVARKEMDECQIHLSQCFPIVKMLIKWNPKWLKEQKERTKPPPLVPDISNASLCFENYDTYFSQMQSLIILNAWDSLYENSKHLFPDMSWKSFHCIIKSQVEKHGMVEIKCEAAVGGNVSYFPSNGDVILLNTENEERTIEHFLFGFITFHKPVTLKEVSSASEWHAIPQTWLDSAKFHIFTAYIKKRKTLCSPSLLLANGVCNIQLKLHAMEYLFKFQFAPLVKSFLQPKKLYLKSDFTPLRRTKESFIQTMCTEITENNEPKIFLVQGTVATGKTCVVLELIEKLLYNSLSKVFVCTPSHSAADEIGLKLVDLVERSTWRGKPVKLVRLGTASKINPKMQHYHLDVLAEKSSRSRKRKELALDERIKNLEHCIEIELVRNCGGKLKDLTDQLTETKTQLRQMTEFAKNWKLKVLEESDVIISTVIDFREYNTNIPSNPFFQTTACCIVDDACQCSEPELLHCLTCGVGNLVLVGDSKQYVTGVSRTSLTSRSHQSLFDRLYAVYTELPHSPMLILKEQHRMHSEICRFPSYYFYKNKLKSHSEVDEKLRLFPLKPYVVMDITPNGDVKKKVLFEMARFLTETAPGATIGVITRETDVAIHREALSRYDDVEVDSVQGFQGREKDVIIVSVTNNSHLDDFVTNEDSLCTSLTRSRKTLIIYGHISSLKNVKHWNSLLKNAKIRGVYVSVASLGEKDVTKTLIEFIIKPF
ncbi:uncharacterized protein [Parasteatoda tepidariorum]|uniref:uncharacterized protein n=1 Tax=Parasteatoda tepidariorum TaxID=114398 RepID=UPI00077FA2A2|nr:uncharacterized protein LOC107438899 [Parasteatoda tepidariorum]